MKTWLAVSTMLLACLLVVGCGVPEDEHDAEQAKVASLSIRNTQFCSNIGEDGDYTVKPGATFDRGEVVWLYFEARGFTVKGVDDKYEVWGKFTDLRLYNPDGDRMGHLVDFTEIHETALDEVPGFLWFYASYESTADDETGEYSFEFMVTDMLSGATGSSSATFALK